MRSDECTDCDEPATTDVVIDRKREPMCETCAAWWENHGVLA